MRKKGVEASKAESKDRDLRRTSTLGRKAGQSGVEGQQESWPSRRARERQVRSPGQVWPLSQHHIGGTAVEQTEDPGSEKQEGRDPKADT